MPKVVPITKRQQQAHEDLSLKHRQDEFIARIESHQFDHKSWWRSISWFWLGVAVFMFFIAMLDYATACGEMESEEVKINTVRGI
ncbi:MAG TPA: hypothetical protein VJ742_00730 [Nitrososphaera sp.]|nr:hypothetical protein [Nitrososphaera sp.]